VAFKKTGNSEFFVSGVPLKDQRIYLMKKGSSIKGIIASPIYYSNILMCFTQDSITVPISLQVNNATYKFSNGNVGIHPISFNANSGELTGVMGGSGTGKSTLLSILNGSNEPSTGQVKINGFDLYSEKNLLNGLIGFVPQDDLLLEDLSVWQNLFYSAKLSFGDLTHEAESVYE
jgi:ABC-type multidrug transport system fused ATPase/permease subunit